MTDVPDGKGLIYALLMAEEWAAREGNDKQFIASAANKTFGQNTETGYIVPAGKILYVTRVHGRIRAANAADGDKDQMCAVYITCAGTGPDFEQGGNGGLGTQFIQPLVYPAGDILKIGIECNANHTCDIRAHVTAYEV